jgi:hypothetical protein
MRLQGKAEACGFAVSGRSIPKRRNYWLLYRNREGFGQSVALHFLN